MVVAVLSLLVTGYGVGQYAAVTLRIHLPPALMLQAPFELAYPVIAWACWVPNLLVAEWLLRFPAPGCAGPTARGQPGLAR